MINQSINKYKPSKEYGSMFYPTSLRLVIDTSSRPPWRSEQSPGREHSSADHRS